MLKASLLALILLAATPVAAQAAATVCPPPAESAEASPMGDAGEVVIACIGSQSLTEATFKHWDEVAAAGDSKPPPSPHVLLSQVMGFLLSAAWVQGEAKALGVHVSAVAVHRQFEEIRRQQFPKLRAFKRFLKKSKETVADLLMRVELDMLSQRIQRRITAGHRGAKAQQKALARFVKHFREKWTAQTYCAPRYAVKDCGHVQMNL